MKTRMCVSVVMALIAGAVLLPPSFAGDLNPPGPPAPTMKTLDQIPPTWDQILLSNDGGADGCNSTRFKCIMNGYAVLDRETGLVWERGPGQSISADPRSWIATSDQCIRNQVVGRKGWKLPTIQELNSLFRYDSDTTSLYLPAGHPFNISDPQKAIFWSATNSAGTSDAAWVIDFRVGQFHDILLKSNETTAYMWCVRTGQPGAVAQ